MTRLGIKPAVFLARLLGFFAATYLLFKPIAAAYTRLLAGLVQAFLSLTETSSDPTLHRVTTVIADGTAIFFQHRLFPEAQFPGIPAEWVQANLVLLIPLMLATPAPTWAQKAGRFALAMALAILLQVLDITVTVKALYSVGLGDWSFRHYGNTARWLYQLGDAFTQSMDTQLFPFAIWAGIHFRQLVGIEHRPAAASERSRAEARRAERERRK